MCDQDGWGRRGGTSRLSQFYLPECSILMNAIYERTCSMIHRFDDSIIGEAEASESIPFGSVGSPEVKASDIMSHQSGAFALSAMQPAVLRYNEPSQIAYILKPGSVSIFRHIVGIRIYLKIISGHEAGRTQSLQCCWDSRAQIPVPEQGRFMLFGQFTLLVCLQRQARPERQSRKFQNRPLSQVWFLPRCTFLV